MKYLALLLFAPSLAHSVEKLSVSFEPANPKPGEIFRVRAPLPGVPCEQLGKITTNFPPAWLPLSEIKAKKDSGCLVVEVVSLRATGATDWPGLKIETLTGKVFEGGGTMAAVGASSAGGAASAESELASYIGHLRSFLSGYVTGAPGANGAFSLESCRRPVRQAVMLFLGLQASLVESYEFKPGCDLQGKSELRLDTPTPFDFQLRNFGGADRLRGLVTLRTEKNGLRVKVKTSISNGELLNGSSSVLKYSVEHERAVELDMAALSLRDLENEGTAHITEFRGRPVSHDEKFSGQNYLVIKKL